MMSPTDDRSQKLSVTGSSLCQTHYYFDLIHSISLYLFAVIDIIQNKIWPSYGRFLLVFAQYEAPHDKKHFFKITMLFNDYFHQFLVFLWIRKYHLWLVAINLHYWVNLQFMCPFLVSNPLDFFYRPRLIIYIDPSIQLFQMKLCNKPIASTMRTSSPIGLFVHMCTTYF